MGELGCEKCSSGEGAQNLEASEQKGARWDDRNTSMPGAQKAGLEEARDKVDRALQTLVRNLALTQDKLEAVEGFSVKEWTVWRWMANMERERSVKNSCCRSGLRRW